MRYELTDYEWAAIRPTLPNKARGVRRGDDSTCPQRHLLGAVIRRTMALPDCYGPCSTCYNRFVRWRRGGSVGADHGRTCRRS
jgi:transposase